jgi:hypothetical protein
MSYMPMDATTGRTVSAMLQRAAGTIAHAYERRYGRALAGELFSDVTASEIIRQRSARSGGDGEV